MTGSLAEPFVLAIRGLGPYCLVERTPETRVWEEDTALCGQSVMVCNQGGKLRAWEPADDPVCAECLSIHQRSAPPTPETAAELETASRRRRRRA
ncbi:hypothetical protein [Nonomuraea longicatena]|uniref:Uncharacterized protein n=1 Tax=Nonomuraea longicatena TaxID=83682 RepID=A0ABP3ZQC8_9ACTN